MVLLRIPTAVQPMTGIEEFKYQASDGSANVINTYSSDTSLQWAAPHAQFLVHSAE